MNGAAERWVKAGKILGHRPAQFLLYLLGAVLVSIALTYSLVTTNENNNDLASIKAAFCNSAEDPNKQIHQCQKLFDQLLAHPTPQQAKRLRQIIQEGK